MKKRVIKLILVLFTFSVLVVTSLFGYKYLHSSYEVQRKDAIYKKYDDIKKLVASSEVDTINETGEIDKYINKDDLRGIISVSGTNINSFIMQSTDNSFYLNHLENGEYNELGSIMLDYRNDLERDKIIVIYGHNAYASYTPFKELENFYQKSFYDNNPYIYITTKEGTYKYQIFTVALVPKKTSRHIEIAFDSNQKYEEHLNWLREISLYGTDVEVNTDDKVLILQTCSIKYDGNFLIIGGRKVI